MAVVRRCKHCNPSEPTSTTLSGRNHAVREVVVSTLAWSRIARSLSFARAARMSDSDDGGYSSQSDTDNPQTLNPLDLSTAPSASSSTQHQAGQPAKAKGKGRGAQGGSGGNAQDKEVRKRSSKACTSAPSPVSACSRDPGHLVPCRASGTAD